MNEDVIVIHTVISLFTLHMRVLADEMLEFPNEPMDTTGINTLYIYEHFLMLYIQ